jgi:ABC-type multidrug transport system fused ATPase/permease subunit
MPPRFAPVFKNQGSRESGPTVVKGDEFRRILRIFNNNTAIALCVLCIACAGAAPLMLNIIMGEMATVMSTDGSFTSKISTLALHMLYVTIAMLIAMGVAIACRFLVSPRFIIELRQRIYSSLLELDVEFFDATPTGLRIGRLSEDVALVREAYFDEATQILQYSAQALAGVIVAFATSWRVALACCVVVPLSWGTWVVAERINDRMSLRFSAASTACIGKAEEVILQFRTVKSFELFECDEYGRELTRVDKIYRTTSWVYAVKDALLATYT